MIKNGIGVMYKIMNRTSWSTYEHEHEHNRDCFIDESALNFEIFDQWGKMENGPFGSIGGLVMNDDCLIDNMYVTYGMSYFL